MLLNQLAAEGYSYNVIYHVRDIIKAALAEAVDQEVLERNVAQDCNPGDRGERETGSAGRVLRQTAGRTLLRPRPSHLSHRIFLWSAPQRNFWAHMGLLPGRAV